MFKLAVLAILSAPAPAPEPPLRLTFIHGDEHLASWVDASTIRRSGDLVRSRILRVRGGVQPFWLVLETDCAASTIANVSARSITSENATPPPFDGRALPSPLRPYYRFERALQAAVCDGRFAHAGTPAIDSVDAAMAAAPALSAQAVRQRPLELMVVRTGRAQVMVDRATLDGGGPQWEARSLKVTGHGGPGTWSWWELDCDSWRRTADLRWSAPAQADGAYGSRVVDTAPAAAVTEGSDEAAVLDATCDPDVWTRPVSSSIEQALAG